MIRSIDFFAATAFAIVAYGCGVHVTDAEVKAGDESFRGREAPTEEPSRRELADQGQKAGAGDSCAAPLGEAKEDRDGEGAILVKLVPIGAESGAILEGVGEGTSVLTNAPYGGLWELVREYLLLVCAPSGGPSRKVKVRASEQGNLILASELEWGFRVGALYCYGAKIEPSGCLPIEVSVEQVDSGSSGVARFFLSCSAGE